MRFSAIGSLAGAALVVYTGTNVAALTQVTNGLASTGVVFNAVSGTNYHIALASWGGGNLQLTWQQTNAPLVTAEPRDWDVLMGSNVTFSVTVSAAPAASYWFRRHGNADLGSITNLVSNVSSNAFILSNVATNDTGNYSLLASNSLGTATSRIAHLQVYRTQAATLSQWLFLTNQFQHVVSAITGSVYVVEASTNLVNWTPIETNTTTFTNFDNTITNHPHRFYRVRTQ